MTKQKKIIVSVTNDLISDNRVHKVCSTLTNMGFQVLLVGRALSAGLPVLDRVYQTKRFRLFFRKSALFYAEYNFRLFLFLLFAKYDLLLANDLDSLTANFVASKLKNKPLVYDSHEYFTEVPELINRPRVKGFWEWLESKMVPGLKTAYTVCDSIAKVYEEKYGTKFKVVRNIPKASNYYNSTEEASGAERIVLYQGAINIGRGLEQAILAMKYLDGVKLVIAGDGDIKTQLEALVNERNLNSVVEFAGRLPIEELVKLTRRAHLGLSIEEDFGLNYRFALPNKLFDYIQAQVPVLVTNLPEMAAIVNHYKVGQIANSIDPEALAEKIKTGLFNEKLRAKWLSNLKIAAQELTWEKEESIIREIYTPFL